MQHVGEKCKPRPKASLPVRISHPVNASRKALAQLGGEALALKELPRRAGRTGRATSYRITMVDRTSSPCSERLSAAWIVVQSLVAMTRLDLRPCR